jgi:hypothetical protein
MGLYPVHQIMKERHEVMILLSDDLSIFVEEVD